ncbi:60S ribosomal protein L18a [Triticum urartu]|uniref:60S ribosomal protein L18a n=1 Tax=Triticum urartu TaxID=4572 RepID=M8AZH7_TRIUA|nr:60S ribosomal protein L18a [Triticum urartu]
MVAFRFHQYQVVGRGLPTPTEDHPRIYRMKLWATNEIFEKNPTTIENFGIWLRYQSRTGYHNMYNEYSDTTLNGAVEQMYTEMASRHCAASRSSRQPLSTPNICKRDNTKQFHKSDIRFLLVYQKVRPPSRKLQTTFKASRPNLFV